MILLGFLPTVPAGVSNHFHAARSGAWRIMWNPSSHAPRPAFLAIGADTWQALWRFHVWENIDMQLPIAVWVRAPKVFPLPSYAAQMFWLILRCNLGSFICLVVFLVAVWLDSMDLSQCLTEIVLFSRATRHLIANQYMQTIWILMVMQT